MANDENLVERSTNWHLIAGTLAFVGIALLPAVIAVIQLFI